MRFLRKMLIGLFLLFATLALAFYAVYMVRSAMADMGDDQRRGGGPRERVFAVNAIPFEPTTHTPVLEVFGEVQSRRILDIRPATGGSVIELHPAFRDGGQVAAGDLLLKIDPSDAQTALSLRQADLSEAEAEMREATRGLDLAQDEVAAARELAALREKARVRQEDLVRRGVGTEAALESAELALSSANQAILSRRQALQQAEARLDLSVARVARVKISLSEAQRRLEDTQVYAAFGGALTAITLVQGGTVTANERIGQLVDPTALEVAFRVSTSQHARLLTPSGALQPAEVTAKVDVFGAEISAKGKLSREAALVGEGQTGRLLFAGLDKAAGMRPGDFVKVLITEAPLDRVAKLPATALAGNNGILVIGEGDRLREEVVTLIRRQGDDVLVQARGLRGAKIVAERSPLLGVGIKVRPLEKLAPGEEAEVPAGPKMVELTDEQRTAMIAFIEGNKRMPAEAKKRVLEQLQKPQVPEPLVQRLQGRMGG